MRFLASLRNDSGGGIKSFALPGTTRIVISTCPRLSALSCSAISTCPRPFAHSCSAIATCPRCHLDRRERSHAVIIRPKKGILGNTRFLASLRNDSGGACNDSGGVSTAFALPGTTATVFATYPHPFALSCSVIATCPRCHLDRRERSHAAIIRSE